MTFDIVFFWLLILAFCELSLSVSVAALIGSAGVLILVVCGWLIRMDLDLLAFLLAATYSSVLVCLSLVQTNLEGYPGLSAAPAQKNLFFFSDLPLLLVWGGVALGTSGRGPLQGFADFYQGEGDWFEQVIAVFHLFFYRTATFEALLLNLFLLLALVASLSILSFISSSSGAQQAASLRGVSRIRLVRSFRRQVRRKNASQIRFAKR
jgi:hypothetical protein